MLKKFYVVIFLLSIFVLGSCTKSTTTADNGKIKYSLNESTKNFNWMGDSKFNDLIMIHSLNDQSYYVTDNTSVKLINSNGTVAWERTYHGMVVTSLDKASKAITFKTDEQTVIRLDKDGNQVWKNGPYLYVDYIEENDLYIIENVNMPKKLTKINEDGSFQFSVSMLSFYNVIDNNIIVLTRENEVDYYVVNYNLDGDEQWRKGPYQYVYIPTNRTSDDLFLISRQNSSNYQFSKIDLNGNMITSNDTYQSIDKTIYTTLNNEVFLAYTKSDISNIVKLDQNLNQIWKSPDFKTGLNFIDFRVYNDELYYIAGLSTSSLLVKVNQANDIVFEKFFTNEISFSAIDEFGVSIVEEVDSLNKFHKYNHQGNLLFQVGPGDITYVRDNKDQSYIVVSRDQSDFYVQFYDKNSTVKFEKGPVNYASVMGVFGDDSIGLAYTMFINETEFDYKVCIINKNGDVIFEGSVFAGEELSNDDVILYLKDEQNQIKELRVSNIYG